MGKKGKKRSSSARKAEEVEPAAADAGRTSDGESAGPAAKRQRVSLSPPAAEEGQAKHSESGGEAEAGEASMDGNNEKKKKGKKKKKSKKSSKKSQNDGAGSGDEAGTTGELAANGGEADTLAATTATATATATKNKKKKKKKRRKEEADPSGGEPDAADGGGDDDAPPVENKHYKIFVGNLSYKTTKEGLERHFKSLKEGLSSVRMLTDKKTKKPRGCAFIDLADKEAFNKAMRLHHTSLDGRQIRVELTAGGGGKSAKRKQKIVEKNADFHARRAKLVTNYMKRVQTAAAEAKASGGDESTAAKKGKKKKKKGRSFLVEGANAVPIAARADGAAEGAAET